MRFILIILFAISAHISFAQELNVKFKINTPKLQKTDPKIFENLEREIQDFLNNQDFTDVEYEEHQLIDCSIQMTIQDEIGDESFTADLIIQATRPVFKSNYKTVTLSYIDSDVSFAWTPSMPIQFADNGYVNELSSTLSFWALMIIGMDYDSYTPFGGDEIYQRAQNLINAMPAGIANNSSGWSAQQSDENRFWCNENLLSPKSKDYREGFYRYHIRGLDMMHDDVATAQLNLNDALTNIVQIRNKYPNAMIGQLFVNAKSNEIVDIMSAAPKNLKFSTYQSIIKIDPSNQVKYRPLQY